MSQENVESVYRAFDAFNRRDLDAYLEPLDPAVEFRSLLIDMENSYHGHEGIRRNWQEVLAVSPDFTLEVVEVRTSATRRSRNLWLAATAPEATFPSSRHSGRLRERVGRRWSR